MKFILLVAIQAGHPLLIMDISRAAILSGEFRINPASMAYGTGFSVVPGNELVVLDKPGADTADFGGFHMAISARGMTAPARLLENLFIEYPQILF